MSTPETLTAAGWRCLTSNDFNAAAGPYWMRGQPPQREVGLLIEPRHSNNAGRLHGGALMTLADIALGTGVAGALGHQRCVTAQLQVQFVASAQAGEFVSCRAEVVRSSRHLVFVRGLIMAGERVVASADGIWKVLEEKQAP